MLSRTKKYEMTIKSGSAVYAIGNWANTGLDSRIKIAIELSIKARQNRCPHSMIKDAIAAKVEELKSEFSTTINSRKAKIPAARVSPRNLSRPLPRANLMSSKEA